MSASPHELFSSRHLGLTEEDRTEMLRVIGVASLDELVRRTVPSSILMDAPLQLPAPVPETDVLPLLASNFDGVPKRRSFIGQGYYPTVTPPVVKRNVLENPAWYTAYTPYQPEISQGRLEAILNFQTMVADLTGMDLANASMLDEGTAAAEAMALCHRLNPKAGDVFFVDADTLPQTIAVVETRAEPLGIEVVVGDPATDIPDAGVFGVLLQYPGASGQVRDDAALIAGLRGREIGRAHV